MSQLAGFTSLLRLNNIPWYVYDISLSVNRHSDCFCILAIVNNDAMNTAVWIYLWDSDFSYVGSISRSKTAGS